MNDQEWPDCSDPDYDKWDNNICAMLVDIKRYRFRMSDPAGYRAWLKSCTQKAIMKTIKGAPKV